MPEHSCVEMRISCVALFTLGDGLGLVGDRGKILNKGGKMNWFRGAV
jgi:hypothetical protein